jgi:hypothetical protein
VQVAALAVAAIETYDRHEDAKVTLVPWER